MREIIGHRFAPIRDDKRGPISACRDRVLCKVCTGCCIGEGNATTKDKERRHKGAHKGGYQGGHEGSARSGWHWLFHPPVSSSSDYATNPARKHSRPPTPRLFRHSRAGGNPGGNLASPRDTLLSARQPSSPQQAALPVRRPARRVQSTPVLAHTREWPSHPPIVSAWIPAFAGMTGREVACRRAGERRHWRMKPPVPHEPKGEVKS